MPSKKNDLKTDPVIEELLQILKAKKMTEHFKKLNESISHISQLENQLETVKKQLKAFRTDEAKAPRVGSLSRYGEKT